MDLLVTLDMDHQGLFHGRVKSLGKALTHVTLNQRPPLGAGGRLSVQRPTSQFATDSATAECVIGSVVASKNRYDVGLLIENWDDGAMRLLFI